MQLLYWLSSWNFPLWIYASLLISKSCSGNLNKSLSLTKHFNASFKISLQFHVKEPLLRTDQEDGRSSWPDFTVWITEKSMTLPGTDFQFLIWLKAERHWCLVSEIQLSRNLQMTIPFMSPSFLPIYHCRQPATDIRTRFISDLIPTVTPLKLSSLNICQFINSQTLFRKFEWISLS
jgi:hypothetical protein